jgi:type I restriction enzyme S subunit
MREGWADCKLEELLKLKNGYAFKSSKYLSQGIPVIRIGDIKDWLVDETNAKCIEENEEYDGYIVERGDILIAMSGATTGKFGIYESNRKAYQNQRVGNLKPHSEKYLHKKYIYLLLYSLKAKIEKDAYGGAQPNISAKKIEAYEIGLAPLPEQRAIVAKIEQLFSELDNGIQNFKKAQEQLKIYRQAVLKKAFEGELTKAWRAKQTKLPTADELLQQIKEEREKYYQNQLTDWKQVVKEWEVNGKVGNKPRKPAKIKETAFFNDEELSEFPLLPSKWQWIRLGNIFQIFVGSTPSRNQNSYWEGGDINWVRSGEVCFSRINQTKEKITELGLNNSSTKIHPPGTVMLAMIGEGKTRGQAGILNVPACHNQNTAAIRVTDIGFSPEYLFHYLFLKYEKNRRVGSGNNQKALNQSRIMEFDYPLCSIQEQHQIVQEIESRLSVCDKLEEDIKKSLDKAEALRQSVLKQAFEGKLLSKVELASCKKEADWEPAEVLLKRIKKTKNLVDKKKKKENEYRTS